MVKPLLAMASNEAAADEAMETEEQVAERPIFSIRVLQHVQTSQAQHGIRHNDYHRYRQYCARRLRRLHVKTKFLHGRTRHQKKKLEPTIMTDERHLHIPLMNAERAWAYSQALKNANADKPKASTRAHAAARLAKAVVWAQELCRLALETADAATVVEAEAYSAWMHATWLSERERDWELSLGKYARAKRLLEELCRVGDFAQQKAARALLEQIEPAVRYARYQLERVGKPEPGAAALAELGDKDAPCSMADLQGRLKEMAASAQASAAAGQQAAVSSAEVTWRGRTYRVANDQVAAALIKVGEAQAALGSCMDADSAEGQLRARDALLKAYRGVLTAVHQQMAVGVADPAAGEEDGPAPLAELSVAIRGLLGAAGMERYLVEAADLTSRWEAAQQRAVLGAKAKGKEKPARAEDLARVYDTLVGIATELGELAGEVGGRDAEALMDEGSAASARFEASRCFYVGAAALAGARYEDAHALFGRVTKLCDAAARKQRELPGGGDPVVASELARTAEKAAAFAVAAAAEVRAEEQEEQEGLAGGVKGMALREGRGATDAEGQLQRQADKFLLANVDKWQSFAGDGGREPRLCQVPPPLESLPARPFVLDAAQNYVSTPSLGHRYASRRTVEKTSTFSKLFGWGSSK